MYYSRNFPNLLSVCEQKELISSKHIRNKEDNCFAKFPLPFLFLTNLPKLQMNQGKQVPPWEKELTQDSNNLLFKKTQTPDVEFHCYKLC